MVSVRVQDSALWATSYNHISDPELEGLHVRRNSPKAHAILEGVAQPLWVHETVELEWGQ